MRCVGSKQSSNDGIVLPACKLTCLTIVNIQGELGKGEESQCSECACAGKVSRIT